MPPAETLHLAYQTRGVENSQGLFFAKNTKYMENVQTMAGKKGAREARSFVDGAIFCTFPFKLQPKK